MQVQKDQPTITITTGQVRMATIGAGASMMLTGVLGLITLVVFEGALDNFRAVIIAALLGLVFAGLSILLYGAIAAHTAVMRHQAALRNGIEEAADARQRRTDEQLAEVRQLIEQQSRVVGEFLNNLEELARQRREDELGPRRERRQV